MLQGKRFGSNEEVIAKTEAYFENKGKSFYKKGIEKLRSVGMNVLHLKKTVLMNKVEFLEKTVFFFVRPETYRVMCYTLKNKTDFWENN